MVNLNLLWWISTYYGESQLTMVNLNLLWWISTYYGESQLTMVNLNLLWWISTYYGESQLTMVNLNLLWWISSQIRRIVCQTQSKPNIIMKQMELGKGLTMLMLWYLLRWGYHYYYIILVLHLRLSSKLPQRCMRLCSVLEKFSFKQFFKHRKHYIRVLHTRRETVPSCWTSMKESTRGNYCLVEVAGTNRSPDAADLRCDRPGSEATVMQYWDRYRGAYQGNGVQGTGV